MVQEHTGPVGIVIAGAGARGAYEAGVLSVVLPWLVRNETPPKIMVGTSAGAMNTALFGALCRPDDVLRGVEVALEVWRGIGREDVFRSVVLSGPVTLARYLTSVTGLASVLPGPFGDDGLTSMLNVAPLRRTIEGFGHWADLHETVRAGYLSAVAAVTTSVGTSTTDVFVESTPGFPQPADDADRAVRYRHSEIGPDQVLASSAIPIAFPPVQLGQEWHLDGGIRLNAPIKPALELGAARLVVVATHPVSASGGTTLPPAASGESVAPPDVFTAGATVLDAALIDRMVEDVRSLDRVNRLVASGARSSEYRYVPYVLVGPPRRDSIASIAKEVLDRRYGGLRGMFAGDYTLLNRLVGGTVRTHGELLSFILFDSEFIERCIGLGQSDAAVALAADGTNLLQPAT